MYPISTTEESIQSKDTASAHSSCSDQRIESSTTAKKPEPTGAQEDDAVEQVEKGQSQLAILLDNGESRAWSVMD
jgi:hypothetical protein